MKKITIITLLILCITTTFAQKKQKESYKFYIAPSGITFLETKNATLFTGYNSHKNDTEEITNWGINPEFGYMINDDFWVALGVGYKNCVEKDLVNDTKIETDLWAINPTISHTVYSAGIFSIYMMASGTFGSVKEKKGEKGDLLGLGLYSVGTIVLSDHFSLATTIAGFAYTKIGSEKDTDLSLIGADGFSFALVYAFGKRK